MSEGFDLSTLMIVLFFIHFVNTSFKLFLKNFKKMLLNLLF